MAGDEAAVNDKEPGNWELYRGIERVEAAVRDMATNSLSTAVFTIEKQAWTQQIEALKKSDVDHQAATLATNAAMADDRKEREALRKEQELQKAQNRRVIVGMLTTPIVAGVIAWIVAGGLAIPK